jgi:hypothetical protein
MSKHLKELFKKDIAHKNIWMTSKAYKTESSKVVSTQQFKLCSDDSFDPVVLRTMLRNWIITSDGAFTDLENPWLQRAFEYTNSSSLQALVTGNTVKSDIVKSHRSNKELLKKLISVILCFNCRKFPVVLV